MSTTTVRKTPTPPEARPAFRRLRRGQLIQGILLLALWGGHIPACGCDGEPRAQADLARVVMVLFITTFARAFARVVIGVLLYKLAAHGMRSQEVSACQSIQH